MLGSMRICQVGFELSFLHNAENDGSEFSKSTKAITGEIFAQSTEKVLLLHLIF